MFTSEVEEQKCVIKALLELNVCPRCILRFLGEKRYEVLKESIQVIMELLSNIMEPDFRSEMDELFKNVHYVCRTCLGILQRCCETEFLEKISSEINNSDNEFKSFWCSLHLPLSLFIRQHSVMVHLKQIVSSVYERLSHEDVISIKEVWKWVAGPHIAFFIKSPFNVRSSFEVYVSFTHEDADKDLNILHELHPFIFSIKGKKRTSELFTKPNILSALRRTSDSKLIDLGLCPPSSVSYICHCKPLNCFHAALFLAGRYNKYSRTLSQTPWIIDGEKKMETSVQELICEKILARIKASEYRFSASGREDVDVRTLGTGRPFVVELINPKVVEWNEEKTWKLQEEINQSTQDISVRYLQIVNKAEILKLKEGEEEKTKTYTSICWIERSIKPDDLVCLKEFKDLNLKQKTPIRVLHRRPLATRDRIIHTMEAEWIDEHHFKLKLNTQAGTYIKEFVHGDFGRTQPNLCTLLNSEVDILELDVESIDIDWPSAIEHSF